MLQAASTDANPGGNSLYTKELQVLLSRAPKDLETMYGNRSKGVRVRWMGYNFAPSEFIDLGALSRKPVFSMLPHAAEHGSTRFLGWLAEH